MRYLYLTSPHMGTGNHPAIQQDVKAAQHALHGYSPGPVDGNWGLASYSATKRAQYKRGFRHVTGTYGPDLHAILTGTAKPSAAQRLLATARARRRNRPSLKGQRYHVLSIAAHEIGQHETPAGTNLQKYGKWYGWNGVPWCAIFTSWCFEQGGFHRYRYAYCPAVLADATNGRNGLSVVGSTAALPGDVVLYCFDGSGQPGHTGILRTPVIGGTFHAVEGNTSLSSDDNGGEVMDRTRAMAQVVAFVRVSK